MSVRVHGGSTTAHGLDEHDVVRDAASMDVDKYLRPFEQRVSALRFKTASASYAGSGTIAWDFERGVRLSAEIHEIERMKDKETLPTVVAADEWIDIYGETTSGSSFELCIPALDLLALMFGRLNVVADAVTFNTPTNMKYDDERHHPFALVDFGDPRHLPTLSEPVRRTIAIGDYVQQQRVPTSAATGLREERPDGYVVTAYPAPEARYLWLGAMLPCTSWTAEDAWNWAKNSGEAFVWLSGRNARAVYVESNADGHIRSLYRRRERIVGLEPYLPLVSDPRVDKQQLLRLLDFLARESKERRIAREMYCQLVDARRQEGVVGRDLLMSSILEAMLRCAYDKPFVGTKAKDNFDLDYCLADFVSKQLGTSYRTIRKDAADAFRRLRDRSAHPDWGLLEWRSGDDARRALADRVLLAHLYAHLVLSFAGVAPAVPRFRGYDEEGKRVEEPPTAVEPANG